MIELGVSPGPENLGHAATGFTRAGAQGQPFAGDPADLATPTEACPRREMRIEVDTDVRDARADVGHGTGAM